MWWCYTHNHHLTPPSPPPHSHTHTHTLFCLLSTRRGIHGNATSNDKKANEPRLTGVRVGGHSRCLRSPIEPSEAKSVSAVLLYSVHHSPSSPPEQRLRLEDLRESRHCSLVPSTQSNQAMELFHCCWSPSSLSLNNQENRSNPICGDSFNASLRRASSGLSSEVLT